MNWHGIFRLGDCVAGVPLPSSGSMGDGVMRCGRQEARDHSLELGPTGSEGGARGEGTGATAERGGIGMKRGFGGQVWLAAALLAGTLGVAGGAET